MTPHEAYALDDDTYRAFQLFQRDEIREHNKAARRKSR
jgi:hypothetical protein